MSGILRLKFIPITEKNQLFTNGTFVLNANDSKALEDAASVRDLIYPLSSRLEEAIARKAEKLEIGLKESAMETEKASIRQLEDMYAEIEDFLRELADKVANEPLRMRLREYRREVSIAPMKLHKIYEKSEDEEGEDGD